MTSLLNPLVRGGSAGGGSLPPGIITVASDFPTIAEANRDIGRHYYAAANVTDNDPTKTNTGQSFITGQDFMWDGVSNYFIVGDDAIWTEDGTDVKTVIPQNIDFQTKGLKDAVLTTALLPRNILDKNTTQTITGTKWLKASLNVDGDYGGKISLATEAPIEVDVGTGLAKKLDGSGNSTLLKFVVPTGTNEQVFPDKSGTFAMTFELPSQEGDTYYVDNQSTHSTEDGSISYPFKSFASAFTVIDPDTTLAEQDRLITLIVNGGIYNEDVTVSAYRNIRMFSKGTVIIGSGDLQYYNSTTSRNLTWNFNSDSETSKRRPQLVLGTLNTNSETTSTHLAYSNGWIISGNFVLPTDAGVSPGGGGTKELILNNVKVQGNLTQAAGNGQTNVYLKGCYFDNTITFSSGNILHADHCEFDGLITASTYCRFEFCEFNGGATIGSYSELIPPGGIFYSKITAGTYATADYRLDQYTKNTLDAGSGSITGTETIIDEGLWNYTGTQALLKPGITANLNNSTLYGGDEAANNLVLSTTSHASKGLYQFSELTTNGLLQTSSGNGTTTVNNTLPNGVLATTQSPGDNSTKVATTAYVDTAVGTENLWDRVTGGTNYLLPHNTADDIGATAARITKGWFTNLESTNMPTVGGTAIDSIIYAATNTWTGTSNTFDNVVEHYDDVRIIDSGWLRFSSGASSPEYRIVAFPWPSATRQYFIKDMGADADFVMTAGTQTLTGIKAFDNYVRIYDSGAGTDERYWSLQNDSGSIKLELWNDALSVSGIAMIGLRSGINCDAVSFNTDLFQVSDQFNVGGSGSDTTQLWKDLSNNTIVKVEASASPSTTNLIIDGSVSSKATLLTGNYNPSILTTTNRHVYTSTAAAYTDTISTEDIQSGSTTLPRQIIVEDKSGGAGTNNITISAESGTVYGFNKITSNYGKILVELDGTNVYCSSIPEYEEYTHTTTFSGIWASPHSVDCKIIKHGKNISMLIPSIFQTATTASTITMTTVLPAKYRPSTTGGSNSTHSIENVIDNTVYQAGRVAVDGSTGGITIVATPAGGNFSGAGNSGFANIALQWTQI